MVPISGMNNHLLDFPHLGNGSQAGLVHHRCSAYRIIYVPEDPAIRKACVVPNYEEPHSHPILPPTKTPVTIKEIYRKCVKSSGLVGSSVRTVDNGKVLTFLHCVCKLSLCYFSTKHKAHFGFFPFALRANTSK